MTKRKFIGMGRKRKSARPAGGSSGLSDAETRKKKKEQWELPDNFILGFTNQHPNKPESEPKKKVNSEE